MAQVTKKEMIGTQVTFTFTFDPDETEDNLGEMDVIKWLAGQGFQRSLGSADSAVYEAVKDSLSHGSEFGGILQTAIEAACDHVYALVPQIRAEIDQVKSSLVNLDTIIFRIEAKREASGQDALTEDDDEALALIPGDRERLQEKLRLLQARIGDSPPA